MITLGDVWVLDPDVLRELPVAHWLPADCRPMSNADRGVVEAGGASLIAMSRFGQERFRDAGFGNALYVPHGIDFVDVGGSRRTGRRCGRRRGSARTRS